MNRYRRSQIAIAIFGAGGLLLLLVLVHAALSPREPQGAALVKQLGLSDLALFTEARYTRHPSQADLHTPFQDHPLSFDHFPSGSLIGPNLNLPVRAMTGHMPAEMLKEARP